MCLFQEQNFLINANLTLLLYALQEQENYFCPNMLLRTKNMLGMVEQ